MFNLPKIVATTALVAANIAHAQTQVPAKELPPPPVPPLGAATAVASPSVVTRQALGAISDPALPDIAPSTAPRTAGRTRQDAPLERLEDAPQLPPLNLAERARAPKAGAPLIESDALVTAEEVREGDIRTGVRVTPRTGRAYTLTDPRQDGSYRHSEGSPLVGRAAVPQWQLFKW